MHKLLIAWEDTRNKDTEYEFNEQYTEEFECLTKKECLAIYMHYDMEQTNDHQIISVFLDNEQIY